MARRNLEGEKEEALSNEKTNSLSLHLSSVSSASKEKTRLSLCSVPPSLVPFRLPSQWPEKLLARTAARLHTASLRPLASAAGCRHGRPAAAGLQLDEEVGAEAMPSAVAHCCCGASGGRWALALASATRCAVKGRRLWPAGWWIRLGVWGEAAREDGGVREEARGAGAGRLRRVKRFGGLGCNE